MLPLPMSLETQAPKGRSYRSHLQPACLPCRKRKSRCKTNNASEVCLSCEVHGTACVYPNTDPVAHHLSASPASLARKRVRTSPDHTRGITFQSDANLPQSLCARMDNSPTGGGDQTYQTAESPRITHEVFSSPSRPVEDPGTLSDTEDHNAHIVGPQLANDSEVFENYFSTLSDALPARRIKTNSTGLTRPVTFTTVPRKPLGTNRLQSLAASKCELIGKLVEPDERGLIQIYLEKSNACLPIFDKSLFLDMYTHRKDKISPALLANLLANAMIYWTTSSSDRQTRIPDARFIWVQAHEALHSETFLSPGTSTVIALILNVSGRPSTSPFNNGGMTGSAVALAHALGLNRDPLDWHISEVEKGMRIRLWWQLVVQDRWCSWSYRTPPQIQTTQYDVKVPQLHVICKSHHLDDIAAAEVALALISLTEVLGYLLEHVYNVQHIPEAAQAERSSAILEARLTSWETNLVGVAHEVIRRGTRLETAGAANLRLSYMATRLLLRRIQLDLNEHSSSHAHLAPSSYHHFRALQAAEEVAWLVQGLQGEQIRDFWQGQNSASLTSAMSFLLRSALQSISDGDAARGDTTLTTAASMMCSLRDLQRKYDWDIANNCVAQYGELVDRLTASRPAPSDVVQEGSTSFAGLEEAIAAVPNVHVLGLDSLFPGLWDMFEP